MFNKILDTGVMPSEWSVGTIVPLYKNKGYIQDVSNYKGITLLSCMGKLFTSIINERLNEYSNKLSLINETQAGFRHGYSTLDHIFLLKCVTDLFNWKKRKLFCLFVDYKKAFDMVWREGLLYKLVKEKVQGTGRKGEATKGYRGENVEAGWTGKGKCLCVCLFPSLTVPWCSQ